MIKRMPHAVALATCMFLFAGGAQAAAMNVFANGGFETNDGTDATGWQNAANGYGISGDAFSGSASMELATAPFGAAVGLQNSVEDGGNPPLDAAGTTPTLSFWAKGFAGTTGNVLYSLRYLDEIGNILGSTGNVFFQGDINPNTWTQITNSSVVVPVGTTAAFLEFSQALGPTEAVDSGCVGCLPGSVLIDDVSLVANVVPVPAAVWLFGSALGLLGFVRRKFARS